MQFKSVAMEFLAGEGINTVASSNKLTISGELASTSNIGVAKFTSDNFDVTSGDVSIITVDGVRSNEILKKLKVGFLILT